MSVVRLYQWECNKCGRKALTKSGLPRSWKYYGGTLKVPGIYHICGRCQQKEKELKENACKQKE
jgi:hypothetical protein